MPGHERCPLAPSRQLYEFFLGAGVLLVLFAIDRKYGEKRPLGLMGFTFYSLLHWPIRS